MSFIDVFFSLNQNVLECDNGSNENKYIKSKLIFYKEHKINSNLTIAGQLFDSRSTYHVILRYNAFDVSLNIPLELSLNAT